MHLRLPCGMAVEREWVGKVSHGSSASTGGSSIIGSADGLEMGLESRSDQHQQVGERVGGEVDGLPCRAKQPSID